MDSTNPSPSKTRVALTWLAMVGIILFLVIFFFTRAHHFTAPAADDTESAPDLIVRSVVFLFAGGFFLVLGIGGYFIVISTGCLTFNYQRPVWTAVKTKQYFANILVMVALGLGFGFILSAFLSPVLTALGFAPGIANMAPVIAVIAGFQILQLWVMVWAPVEKIVIVKRLAAMGITADHLKTAVMIGISNPASGVTKRFAAIEEDVGALWITPQHLLFRCDGEQFDLAREQVAEIERKADNRSTTVLAGIAHVILHVRLPDGTIRRMRLHAEAVWTMGRKKRVMDSLADAIHRWYTEPIPALPASP